MKRKILFVVHRLNYGGVQKALISVLDSIDYSENEVTLYVRKNSVELLPNVNPAVHRVIVNRDEKLYRRPRAVFLLAAMKIAELLGMDDLKNRANERLNGYIIRRSMEHERDTYFKHEEYDLAISYIQGYTAEFVAEYVSAKKKVMFFHGSEDETHELHLRIMPFFSRIVAVNGACAEILRGLYPDFAGRIAAMENYVDASDVVRLGGDRIIDRKGHATVLCTCGRLSLVKGFDIAVEAARLIKSDIDFIWYFVGDGYERETLERLISSSDLSGRIVITGMKDNPYPYIKSCDIYVQPSRAEAHPVVLLEAMALARPIVSTDTVGGRFVLEQNKCGLLSEMNGEALAKRILTLYNDKALMRRFEEAERAIDWEARRVEFCRAWKELLAI